MHGTTSADVTGAEHRAAALGLEIPDYATPPYGERYGTVKAFHRVGPLVFLSGMTPESRDGRYFSTGRVGVEVSVAEARQAARRTAVNVLGMIRYALGSLDEVRGVANSTYYVQTGGDFHDVHLVGEGALELLVEVFGQEAGRGPNVGVGVAALSHRHCFELQLAVEARSAA